MMILFLQWGLYICSYLWKPFVRYEYRGLDNIKNIHRPIIFASNHRSTHDHVFLLFSPPKLLSKILPIRFPVTSDYYDKFYYRMIISPLGCFRMNKWSTSLDDYLKETLKVLRDGGVILFFPEGRVVKHKKECTAKPGLAYLAQKTGATVVPINLCVEETCHFFLKKKTVVSFGKPIKLIGDDYTKETLSSRAQNVLDIIYSL